MRSAPAARLRHTAPLVAVTILLLLPAWNLFGNPQITNISPTEGFTFTTTRVTITGTDLIDPSQSCAVGASSCNVIVQFGALNGAIVSASPTQIVVDAPPQDEQVVGVTIESPGRSPLSGNLTFHYYAFAMTTPADYDGYLLPSVAVNLPGQYGSMWTTDFTIYNPWSTLLLPVWNTCLPNVSPCPSNFVAAQGSSHVVPLTGGVDGAFIYIPKALDVNGSISMNLRARDTSHGDSNFGTELPIVSLSKFRNAIRLVGIPTDPRYRITLRIYSANSAAENVAVQVFPDGSIQDTYDAPYTLTPATPTDVFVLSPAVAVIDLTQQVQSVNNAQAMIEVSALLLDRPVDPIWAFVSVTNNQTQQVTTVTPQP